MSSQLFFFLSRTELPARLLTCLPLNMNALCFLRKYVACLQERIVLDLHMVFQTAVQLGSYEAQPQNSNILAQYVMCSHNPRVWLLIIPPPFLWGMRASWMWLYKDARQSWRWPCMHGHNMQSSSWISTLVGLKSLLPCLYHGFATFCRGPLKRKEGFLEVLSNTPTSNPIAMLCN